MYNFDSYNVLLSIATNIPVLLMTALVLQGHILYPDRCYFCFQQYYTTSKSRDNTDCKYYTAKNVHDHYLKYLN